ncbi:MAG: chromate transporter [Bacteroidetes bacterium]|nr:chromate transporter [Bacteroidota bacterium]
MNTEKTPEVSSRIYWQMFITFVRIGAFTIGGGYAMIPLIQREVVQVRKWISPKEFIDMLALAQSAPGVIAINTAIFIGYKIKGIRGSIVTALGCALPSFVIILLIAMVFSNFKDNAIVERIFKGIRPVVVALIAALLIWGLNISPVWIVMAAIAGGIIYGTVQANRLKNRN